MKIISFGWTVPAFRARAKTCTRRDWAERYAQSFRRGDLVQAWDHLPRAGGHRIGTIQLTADPVQTTSLPITDWVREGFKYLSDHDLTVNGQTPEELWMDWRTMNPLLWVIRFKIEELYQEERIDER